MYDKRAEQKAFDSLKSNMDRFIDSNISRAPLADYL